MITFKETINKDFQRLYGAIFSVRMYTATKSLGRFRQPKSVEDEKKSVDNAIPKSTAYKTKWSCKIFEEWKQNRLVKSCTLEPGGLFTLKE